MNAPILPEHTVILVAPLYNRSGYGISARALAMAWHRLGIRIRTVPVNEVAEGIDDFDMAWLRSMESTPLRGRLAAIFYHVPGQAWLDMQLPPGCLRVMYTTFDSSAQGNLPPAEWIRVCSQMDQLWLQAEEERGVWVRGGMDPGKIWVIGPLHGWIDNPALPLACSEPRPDSEVFRFLCIGMFQPRRRWDTLLEAFLEEFREEPRAELFLKVNYPSWHPLPGKPKMDLANLIQTLRERIPSKARIKVDESMDTRLGICRLIDGCDVYVSTDTCATTPIMECLVRGKRVVASSTYGMNFPESARLLIWEDPGYSKSMTEEMLEYQPHHRGQPMPLLRVEDVRKALRAAFEIPLEALRNPWEAWDKFLDYHSCCYSKSNSWATALADAWSANPLPLPVVRWEGSQFVFHSLAHVNRQLCLGLLRAGEVELSLVPYEPDQFDGASSPMFHSLAARVNAPLSGTAQVHVRHQWPPNFSAPPEGCWVMIQPWEFGGIPQAWVEPMSREVDEIWVPSTWVRDCYLKSGIPESRVVVVPNGVDPEVFRPEGERFQLRTGKRFKFLFLGGTIHRKGIDLLLQAYQSAFRATDDVCLVIKGQAGEVYRGNELDEAIRQIRQDPEAPEIEYRVETFAEPELAALYRSCDAFVLPYRGEGFGLPIAEAMASGLPVIVTGRGAAMDFVREEWAYLIPSRLQPLAHVDNFKPSQAGFWLEEPDVKALVALLRSAFENPEEGRVKGRRARDYAVSQLGWERPVAMILERLKDLALRQPCRFGPSVRKAEAPEALIYEPDWTQAEWVEVVLAYLQAFAPGEPVALVLPLAEGPDSLSPEAAQQAVIDLITRTGREAFPDIVIVDTAQELTETLTQYGRSQRIPKGRGCVEGLKGAFGLRFAQVRMRMSGT